MTSAQDRILIAVNALADEDDVNSETTGRANLQTYGGLAQ